MAVIVRDPLALTLLIRPVQGSYSNETICSSWARVGSNGQKSETTHIFSFGFLQHTYTHTNYPRELPFFVQQTFQDVFISIYIYVYIIIHIQSN